MSVGSRDIVGSVELSGFESNFVRWNDNVETSVFIGDRSLYVQMDIYFNNFHEKPPLDEKLLSEMKNHLAPEVPARHNPLEKKAACSICRTNQLSGILRVVAKAADSVVKSATIGYDGSKWRYFVGFDKMHGKLHGLPKKVLIFESVA